MPGSDPKSIWWPLALSEEVNGKKPLGAHIGAQPVVLWRDAQGIVRALEDRCPHRRAPLSLGCVRDNGWIQCGYHGWSYEGGSGRLQEIPNLKGEQRYPPLYRAQPFAVSESGGFVRVCLDDKATATAPQAIAHKHTGYVDVALDHSRFMGALLDDPNLVLHIPGVRFTPYVNSDLKEHAGRLVMERTADWSGLKFSPRVRSEFGLNLKLAIAPGAAEIDLELSDADLNPIMAATLAPVPAARGVTAVRWRAQLAPRLHGARQRLYALHAQMSGGPLQVRAAVDGRALRTLEPFASLQYEQLIDPSSSAARSAA